jgi:hypothetical protein
MDPLTNPFSPGAGTPPPELAGRDQLLESLRIAIERTRRGRSTKSALMIGLRGVGKTVLLDRIRMDAEATGIHSIRIEVPENRSLPALLAPELRKALLRLSRIAAARESAERGLRALAGFVGALRVKFGDIEVGLDLDPEPGLADSGDLEYDLQVLLETVGGSARAASSALVLFVDEMQYVREAELGALITGLHRVAQRQLPVMLVGAGLPQLRGQMGDAKSYAERLFNFPEIGPLDDDAARVAITKPIRAEGADIEEAAVDLIIESTQRFPYFLQEWGKHVWDVAQSTPITHDDVVTASREAMASLDEGFFRVRFDRLTPSERMYLRAMAELGPGPHRSGDVAAILGRKVTSLGPTRSQLIAKGMIWSPGHGDTAFTVPLFDEFMKRIMPEFEP